MRIALDAMGTDKRPGPDVAGGVLAARAYNDTILLVGPEERINSELQQHNTNGLSIEIIAALDEIAMDDKPSAAMKTKKQSSMHIGMQLVRDGKADAFVSMGNTGAAYAIAMLDTLKRLPGVKRPALTAVFPIWNRPVIFMDVGANADARVDWLEQFAVMGSVYAETALGIERPKVATLSNGEEEGKGNQLTREAQEQIRALNVNYIGHIEPKEVLSASADVVVMDGFVGNVFIKTFEGSIYYFSEMLQQEITASPLAAIGALLSRRAFRRVRKRLDSGEVGGAPLLGVNGVVIIGHGSADANAVKNAINQARLTVQGNTVERLRERLINAEDIDGQK